MPLPTAGRLGLVVASLLLVAACAPGDREGAADRGWAGTVDTLPSGALVVRNPEQGMWDSSATWRIREELRIGSADADGPEMFGDVADLAVDSTGRLWVLDGQAEELRLFDADGRYVRTVARKGNGPGELAGAAAVLVMHGGEGVVVVDYGNQRYARFDTAGRYLGAVRRPFGFSRYPFVGGIDSTGAVLEQNMLYATASSPQRDVLFRIDTAGVVTDTIALPSFEPEMVVVRNERGQPLMSRVVPFAPQLAYAVDQRGHLWSGVSDKYRLVQRAFGGDTLRVIERAGAALPVDDAELEEVLATWEEFESRGARLDRSRIPSTQPFFGRIWPDDRGHLWVTPTLPREQRGRALDVFDPDGRYLGRATSDVLLNSWVPPRVIGDRLYAVVRDSMDVPYVIRARIDGRERR